MKTRSRRSKDELIGKEIFIGGAAALVGNVQQVEIHDGTYLTSLWVDMSKASLWALASATADRFKVRGTGILELDEHEVYIGRWNRLRVGVQVEFIYYDTLRRVE